VRRALNFAEVTNVRERLHEMFDRAEARRRGAGVRSLMPSAMFQEPAIYRIMLNERIVTALKTILEPHYTMFGDLTSAKDQFGLSGFPRLAGWHWDASSEGKQPYLLEQQYRFVKCGVYLQENTRSFGGDIDLVPGRHRWPFRGRSIDLSFKVKTVFDYLGMWFTPLTVPLEPGDFLAFHSCLPHRSTMPMALLNKVTEEDRRGNTIAGIPRDQAKYTIYWNACRTRYAPSFMANSLRRAREEELANPARTSFLCASMPDCAIPRIFPPISWPASSAPVFVLP
jgi:hypothetical protein